MQNYKKMLTGDLIAEIAYLLDTLTALGQDIPRAPGWFVKLYDAQLAAANAEMLRRQRAKTAPTVPQSRLSPHQIQSTVEATDLLALIERETGNSYTKAASTNGGEWKGACPWCGGNDRFCIWNYAERAHYWCRQCRRGGDAIQFLRDFRGLSFPEAVQELARGLGREIKPQGYYAPRGAAQGKKWKVRKW